MKQGQAEGLAFEGSAWPSGFGQAFGLALVSTQRAMSRRRARLHALRIDGSYHHVTAHGVGTTALFADDIDWARFIRLLGRVTRETRWHCLLFCLMTTHYHLVVQERETPLSDSMRLLNGRYARHVNLRHERRGHVFDGPYDDGVIADDAHLFSTVRYVARNPVEADIAPTAAAWRWSSYAQLVGGPRRFGFVHDGHCLSLFAPNRERAIRIVREFVEG